MTGKKARCVEQNLFVYYKSLEIMPPPPPPPPPNNIMQRLVVNGSGKVDDNY